MNVEAIFLVAFLNKRGVIESRVVSTPEPINVAVLDLTLRTQLPSVAWRGMSYLPQEVAPPGANYKSDLVVVIDGQDHLVVLEHDQRILTTEDFRSIEENIRASRGINPKASLCVVACEPIYEA